MKILKKLKELIREVTRLITSFIRPCGIEDPILDIPQNIHKMGQKLGITSLAMTIIGLAFSFLLKLTNMMIEYKFILLGIILFMLYRAQQVLRESMMIYRNSERQKYALIYDDEIVLRGSKIIGNVSDRVLKFDKTQNLYKIMSNESILNSIQNYLDKFWQQKVQHIFDVAQIISVILMLFVAIITNTAIPQYIFVPLVLFFVILSFLTSAYISMNRTEFFKKDKEYNNEQATLKNDLLRIPTIVKADLNMRIGRFQKTVVESHQNVRHFHRKLNFSRLIISIVETLSQYGIIVFYLLGISFSEVSLASIAEITATLVILETALSNVSRIAETLNSHNERRLIIEREEEDIRLILDVYYKEAKKASEQKEVTDILINPFSIKYLEESENDKPFTLSSTNSIEIKSGEIIILSGVSGSGKSTFMKLLTERIKVEKSTEIPATSRYLFYDEKLKFGSLTIYEELFCSTENPNHEKMQEILENLHLWSEIKRNCFDVWQWMKEKKFDYSLSNGQKQRLILAKMLYWLDDTIDVMVLDECTSGLDDKSEGDSADAERILEYIVRYCNKDKQRIIIISTHQNISGFVKALANEYNFRNLHFKKEGERNVVYEITN